MFQFRRFPSYTYVFSIWCMDIVHADCSIRISADLSLLATPRSFSQLTTSFFGFWCQGILPALLSAWPFWIMLSLLLKAFTKNFCFSLIVVNTRLKVFLTFCRLFPHLHLPFFFYSIFKLLFSETFVSVGGHKWTRTTDLTLIRRAL